MKSSLFSEIECKSLLEKYSIVPVAQCFSLNFDTSLSVYLKTNAEFLLESAESGEGMGRYSFIGKGVHRKFVLYEDSVEDWNKTSQCKKITSLQNPLEYVQSAMREYTSPKDEVYRYPPFWGGLLGYLGYETIGYYENIEQLRSKEGIGVPDGILVIPEILMVVDHLRRSLWIISIITKIEEYNDALQQIKTMWDTISRPLANNYLKYNSVSNKNTKLTSPEHPTVDWNMNMSKAEYLKKIDYCKERILNGDVIQIVLSRRIATNFSKDNELLLYIYLRNVNPSPYMYYLKFDDFSVIGSSPEVMSALSVDGTMKVKPIAGTIRRGNTVEEDKALQKELMQDEKERAEHIMLVDLGRNDLHRISVPGTVYVSKSMQVDGYSHVYHIVSTVEGQIQDGYDGFDLIRATFPAGTLSGAPKIEAMNIIGRTEPSTRGIYGGLVMVMGFNGYLDSCIAIRTAVVKNDTIYLQAGGGLVADSDPEKEWKETKLKLGALVQAVEEVLAREK